MLPVKKGATKRCCFGVCKSDSRSKSFKDDNYYFIGFPKPCLDYRRRYINCPRHSRQSHIKNCIKCTKSELWVKSCGRADGRFKSLEHVTKDTYICSLHFEGESGPSAEYPNPIKLNKQNQQNKVNQI